MRKKNLIESKFEVKIKYMEYKTIFSVIKVKERK